MTRPGRVILVLVLVLSLTGTGIAIAQLSAGGTFTDDDGSIFEPSIEAIAAVGITKGCNPPFNDRFCPKDPVTRGQMAAFIVRARGLTDAGGGNHFVDDDDSIFEGDIDRLFVAEITRGCNPPANDMFCPDRPVTREEMAAFLVRAYDYTDAGGGDHFVDDDDSIFEGDIDRLFVAGVTKGCNPPINDTYCPKAAVTREQMAAFLQRAEGLDPIIPPPAATPTLTEVADDLAGPVHVTAPAGDDRLFIVEKAGTIRILENGSVNATPFLDITGKVIPTGERGLLSMAFHPDYGDNGRFLVYYSAPDPSCSGSGCHKSVVAEYGVSANPDVADPNETVVLEIDQPFANHNGGQVEFGPDGMLYIGLGDGGSGNDPQNNGQRKTTLLGKLLRIDVDGDAPYVSPPDNPFVGEPGRDEIWAYGLRNPWRYAFDGDDLYIADVGQNTWEEINAVGAGDAGVNYGWCIEEGFEATGLAHCSGGGNLTDPVLVYGHSVGCSVTGGRVYRGDSLPALQGHYFYSDLCGGFIKSFRLSAGQAVDRTDWTGSLGALSQVVSFGEDGNGNLYVVSLGGSVYRLDAE